MMNFNVHGGVDIGYDEATMFPNQEEYNMYNDGNDIAHNDQVFGDAAGSDEIAQRDNDIEHIASSSRTQHRHSTTARASPLSHRTRTMDILPLGNDLSKIIIKV